MFRAEVPRPTCARIIAHVAGAWIHGVANQTKPFGLTVTVVMSLFLCSYPNGTLRTSGQSRKRRLFPTPTALAAFS